MNDPMFVMSMYANKQDLYEAKAKYYMEKSDRLEAALQKIADHSETLGWTPASHIAKKAIEDIPFAEGIPADSDQPFPGR